MNLFRRVAFSLLLPLIILLVTLSVQSVHQYRKNLTKNRQNDTIHAEVILERLDALGRELKGAASLIAESRDSSRAVKMHDIDYLYEWSRLFHSDFLSGIVITDNSGTVLIRSYDQFRFSDNMKDVLPVNMALEGEPFWGLIEFDGELSFVYSRAVLLYDEFQIGTVVAVAGLTNRLLEHLSDSHTVGIRIGEDWPGADASANPSAVREFRTIETKFSPRREESSALTISFYKTEDSQRELRQSIINIALLVLVMSISLILVFLVLSNYVRPYSALLEAVSLMARKEVDFDQLRQRLQHLSDVRNKEAVRIAAAFTELSYAIQKDISHLEDSAHQDALTGLRNRRFYDKVISRDIKRNRSEKGSLSIIMADIDHFKMVNDSFGHDFGDEVLKKVAWVFRDICRGADVPLRWGGEEFMVICPFTDLAGCRTLAEKLRERMEESIVPFIMRRADDSEIEFSPDCLPIGTISLGCAVLKENHDEQDIYKAADKALYRAKEGGRNRVAY